MSLCRYGPTWVFCGIPPASNLWRSHRSCLGLTQSVAGDLKPDNILIGQEMFERIRVSDYGQARIVSTDVDEAVAATMNVGTDGYNAPETIARGSTVGIYDKKIDVWSLGVIAYMCAMGRPRVGARHTWYLYTAGLPCKQADFASPPARVRPFISRDSGTMKTCGFRHLAALCCGF